MATDPTQLNFINEAERQYFAEAVLGTEVEQFLVTDVGRFLRGCAKSEYDACRDKLFELDLYTAEGKKEHDKLKMDAWGAAHFTQWCAEAIVRGREAEVLLNESREGEGQ